MFPNLALAAAASLALGFWWARFRSDPIGTAIAYGFLFGFVNLAVAVAGCTLLPHH